MSKTLSILEESNKKRLIYKVGHACAGLALLAAGGFFFLEWDSVQNVNDKISLITRTFAASAIYFQSDFYRRQVFILLPKPTTIYLWAGFSALLYIVCISCIISYGEVWLFIFGVMLLILFFQNIVTYTLLHKNDTNNPLLPYFKRWFLASIGYFFVVIIIAPMAFTLKTYKISIIEFPWWKLSFDSYYIDVAPSLIIIASMILSAIRIDENISTIINELNQYYETKEQRSTN